MAENQFKELIQKQNIESKLEDLKAFKKSIFSLSILFVILFISVLFFKLITQDSNYFSVVIFIVIACIYQLLYLKSKRIVIGFYFSIAATIFYVSHFGFELFMGFYPKDFLTFLSFKHLSSTYKGAARTMNIVTLFVDLIPHMCVLIRLTILGIFIKGIYTSNYLKNNKNHNLLINKS